MLTLKLYSSGVDVFERFTFVYLCVSPYSQVVLGRIVESSHLKKKKALLLLTITDVLTTCAVVRLSKSPLFLSWLVMPFYALKLASLAFNNL